MSGIKYMISIETLKTCAQGALGAMTFGAYHMYVSTEMMKQNNQILRMEQDIKNKETEQQIKELQEQIKKRWFF